MLTKAIDIHFTEYQIQYDPILPVVIRKLILYKLCTLITWVRFICTAFYIEMNMFI